jgi:hypothetical protein
MGNDEGHHDGVRFGMLFCALVWLLATPVLLVEGVFGAATFYGEAPSPQAVAEAHAWLYAGAACGVLLPLAGIAMANAIGSRAGVVLFSAALVLAVGALAYLATH